MKSKTEIRDWILENCVEENGDVDLSFLDLRDAKGDIYISGMKVKNNLYQGDQKVEGDLFQRSQKVEGDLFQDNQKVGVSLWEDKLINGKTKEQAMKELEELYG